MTIEKIVEQKLLAELSLFDGEDLNNPPVSTSMHKTVMLTLVDIRDDYPIFDAKAQFDYGDDPTVTILWWMGIQAKQNTTIIKFNPLRIDNSKRDLLAAYERAMSVL